LETVIPWRMIPIMRIWHFHAWQWVADIPAGKSQQGLLDNRFQPVQDIRPGVIPGTGLIQ
jgi:hypothetical protein